MKTKPLPHLPPELRRAINKRAHSLALVAEIAIRDRLAAMVQETAQSAPQWNDPPTMSDLFDLMAAELGHEAMTVDGLMALCTATAVTPPPGH